MADNIHNSSSGSGGSSGPIIFIVGGLVVAVGVLAWLFTGGEMPSGGGSTGGDINVDVQAPAIEDGGSEPAGGAADGAAGGGDAAGGN